jgi:hypothetical protein
MEKQSTSVLEVRCETNCYWGWNAEILRVSFTLVKNQLEVLEETGQMTQILKTTVIISSKVVLNTNKNCVFHFLHLFDL